jgi:hypothetical protein
MAKRGLESLLLAGFHCYESLIAILRWTGRAHRLDGRYAVRILVEQTRPKPTAAAPFWPSA